MFCYYDYCEAKNVMDVTIIALTTYIYTENCLQNMSNCLQMCVNTAILVMISANYTKFHDYCLS